MSQEQSQQPGAGESRGRVPPAQAHQLPEPLPANPLPILKAWVDEAMSRRLSPNPNSMMLATVDESGRPDARVVLCKAIDVELGSIVFYTNTRSPKGRELAMNPEAALVMHWDLLERQVRVRGPAVRCAAAEDNAYFATRPWTSRIGAWASDQSAPLASRDEMVLRVAETMQRFGIEPLNPPPEDAADVEIPRPLHWGGYRIFAREVELWVAGAGRIHDRGVWKRELTPGGPDAFQGGEWQAGRVQP